MTAGVLACCLAACWPGALGCRNRTGDVTIASTIEPNPPVAGEETVVRLTLKSDDGKPLPGAALRLEAHMSHPGMAPVTADVVERGNGAYDARVRLPMSGDWIFVVSGTLANGTRVAKDIQVGSVRNAGEPPAAR